MLWSAQINGYIRWVNSRRREAVGSFVHSMWALQGSRRAGELKSRGDGNSFGLIFFLVFFCLFDCYLLFFLSLGSAWPCDLWNVFFFCFHWYLFWYLVEICGFFLVSFYSFGLGCVTQLHLKDMADEEVWLTFNIWIWRRRKEEEVRLTFNIFLLMFYDVVSIYLCTQRSPGLRESKM
jgi:hypothetical protein